jgi:hypothetical protein
VPAAPARAWIAPAAQRSQVAAGPSLRRSAATLALFVVGIAAGVGAYVALDPPPQLPTYPPLSAAPEPASAHALATALDANDPRAIADDVLPGVATDLSNALEPIVEVTGVTYVGTAERNGQQLAGYVVRGRDKDGQKQIIGLVIDVAEGHVMAINQ